MKKQKIFNMDIISATQEAALLELITIANGRSCDNKIVVTPNVDHVVKLSQDDELLKTYSNAEFIFPDGMPIILASRLLGKPLHKRITGADLFDLICNEAAKSGLFIYVVGGDPKDVAESKEKMTTKYPGLSIEIDSPEYGFVPEGDRALEIALRIKDKNPDIVFICLGFPKQEIFSFKYKDEMGVKLIFCVGASMDFAIGKMKRAPQWVQKIGFEWFWRMCSDPKRLVKRYLIEDIRFVGIVFKEWLKRSKG